MKIKMFIETPQFRMEELLRERADELSQELDREMERVLRQNIDPMSDIKYVKLYKEWAKAIDSVIALSN